MNTKQITLMIKGLPSNEYTVRINRVLNGMTPAERDKALNYVRRNSEKLFELYETVSPRAQEKKQARSKEILKAVADSLLEYTIDREVSRAVSRIFRAADC